MQQIETKEFVIAMRAVISIAKNASGLTPDDERVIAAAEAALAKIGSQMRRDLSIDKFDRFIANLDEFLVTQPYKVVGDANIGYWKALHAIRTAAHEAKCASQSDAGSKQAAGDAPR